MEAKKEKSASPEEKLLKVIQDGGKEGGASAKPGLKLAKIGDKPAEAPPAKVKKGTAIPAAPVAAPDRKGGSGLSVVMVNRILGAVAAVFVLLTGLQIFAAMQSDRSGRGGGSLPPPGFVAPSAETNEAGKMDFPIFDALPEVRSTTTTSTVTTLSVPWQVYVKENLDLKGFGSPGEAILFDKKQSKMHVLKVGQKLTVADREVVLTKIGTEEVELSDGKQSLPIK